MTKQELINRIAKYTCNSCEMGCNFEGKCYLGSDYETCRTSQETANKIYVEIICKRLYRDEHDD